jgi:Superinfection immunity protein
LTLLILALVWYFIPWLVAVLGHHRQRYAILALNLFLGWTLVGWVLALVWALTRDR